MTIRSQSIANDASPEARATLHATLANMTRPNSEALLMPISPSPSIQMDRDHMYHRGSEEDDREGNVNGMPEGEESFEEAQLSGAT